MPTLKFVWALRLSSSTQHIEKPADERIAMKKLAAFALLWLAAYSAGAQTLSPGVAIGAMSAHRDMSAGITTISAQITNTTKKTMTALSVTFTLYDANNRQIGTARDRIDTLAAGAIWPVAAKTSIDFNRFSAMEIVAH
jgi:hypothetical protein